MQESNYWGNYGVESNPAVQSFLGMQSSSKFLEGLPSRFLTTTWNLSAVKVVSWCFNSFGPNKYSLGHHRVFIKYFFWGGGVQELQLVVLLAVSGLYEDKRVCVT